MRQFAASPLNATIWTVRFIHPQMRLRVLLLRISHGKVQNMMRRNQSTLPRLSAGLVLFMAVAAPVGAEPTPAVTATYNADIAKVEARLAGQHQSTGVSLEHLDLARLQSGQTVVEQIEPENTKLPGALLYHWRGTAFVPGAKAADFERAMKDYDAYPKTFSPEMLQAHVLSHAGEHYQVTMRVRQKHILTAVLDITYDVTFGRGGSGAPSGYTISRSTHIAEIDQAGTPQERVLAPGEEHGYLWRQNNYWSYAERDGGLYIQIESISLSRAFPAALGWAFGSFTKSIPRETMEFTLGAMCKALRK
jgi:hypothetical protein